MTKAKSIARDTLSQKPARPDGSPIFWHSGTSRWAKKILGRTVYFGRGSHDDALAEYEHQKDELHSGRRPREEEAGGLTVYSLCAKFLEAKVDQRESGELSPRTVEDYAIVCKLLIKKFGKHRPVSDLEPIDFQALRKAMCKTWGPVRVGKFVTLVGVVFNYGKENGLCAPVVFGTVFKRPRPDVIERHKQERGPRSFEAVEIRRMLDAASPGLKAMLLLAINAGMGNSDIANMPIEAVNFDTGWITYPRKKTAVKRKVWLWPETLEALRQWLAVRPEPMKKEHQGLLFITQRRGSFAKATSENPISKEVGKLLASLKINGHRGFYGLRHTYMNTAENLCKDFLAVRSVMGHKVQDVSSHYRADISDERLRAATQCVHDWLFAEDKETPDLPPKGETAKHQLRIVG